MAKVFIGVGHGGSDPGAVKYIVEKEANLVTALACKEFLEANGVTVRMSRMKDENDDLNEEIRECNAFNPDLAIDVHNNAGGGDGFEAWCTIRHEIAKTLATNVEAEVKAIGQNSRGVKMRRNTYGTDFYGFNREVKAPNAIFEGAFVDNATDVKLADTNEELKAFGYAYGRGVLKTLIAMGKMSNAKPETQPEPKPETKPAAKKTVLEIAKEVIAGKWGNGGTRKNLLTKAGYNYSEVQSKVDELLTGKKPTAAPTKTATDLAKEVIAGKWGNGADRKKRLTDAGYDYTEVQSKVDELLSGKQTPAKKSVDEIAKEVIAGKWGNGNARKKALTDAGYDYSAIQKRVNELM